MESIKNVAIAVAILVVVFLSGRYTAPTPEPRVVTETVVDTTVVDSLKSEIEYLRSIEPDTVETIVEVPVPTVNEDSTRTYEVPYNDEIISSTSTVTVDGYMEEFVFQYFLKNEVVREKTIIRTRIINRNTTTTKTTYVPDRQFFELQLTGGYKMDLENYYPYVEIQPQVNLFEIRDVTVGIVGTAHISNNPFIGAGIKLKL